MAQKNNPTHFRDKVDSTNWFKQNLQERMLSNVRIILQKKLSQTFETWLSY